jgi:hypothetical protein
MLLPYELYFSELYLSELFLSAPTSTDADESASSLPIWVLIGVVATWATALTLTLTLG